MQPEQPLTHGEAKLRAARSVASVFGRHALVRLLAFLGTLVIARLIAPESFGLFVTAQFILAVLQALAVGGVTAAIVRRAEAVEPDDYRTAFTVQQGLAVLAVLGFFFAAPFVTAAYGLPPERALVFQVMALAVFPISARSIPLAMLQRSLRYDLAALCDVLEYLVYIVVAVSLAILGFDVWALVAGTLARQLFGAVLMGRLARAHLRVGFAPARARALMQTAVPLQAQMLIDLAQRSMIPVFVGFLFGVTAVGIAGMANTIVEMVLLQPLVMLASVQFRMFARIQNVRDQTRELLENCYAANAMVFLPAIILVALFAEGIVPVLLSPAWSEVGVLASWLAIAASAQLVASPTAQAAKALGELRVLLIAGLISLATQAACLLAAAPLLGLLAYPAALAIGASLGTLIIWVRLRRRLSMSLVRPLLPILAANAVAGGLWLGAARLLPSGWMIAVAVALGALVYLALLVLLAGEELSRLLRFAGQVGPVRWRALLESIGSRLEKRGQRAVGGGGNA